MPVASIGDATALAGLDNTKSRVAEIESMETVSVLRHEEILEEVKKHQAKEVEA